MIEDVFPGHTGTSMPSERGKVSIGHCMETTGAFRLPADPLYYADVSVKNMVVGSAWIIGYDNAGTFTTLDSGTCTVTDFTISGVPAYSSSFLLELRARKGTAATKYLPFTTYAYHSQSVPTIYVSQVEDLVA